MRRVDDTQDLEHLLEPGRREHRTARARYDHTGLVRLVDLIESMPAGDPPEGLAESTLRRVLERRERESAAK